MILSTAKRNKQTGKLTHAQRRAILEQHQQHPGMIQSELAKWAQDNFHLLKAPSQSSISAIINKKLQSMSSDAVIADDSKKRLRIVQFPELDESLRLWVLQCESRRIPISGLLIQEKAKLIATELGIPNEDQPSFSVGWLIKFQERYSLGSFKLTGEAGSADEVAIEANLPKIIETIRKFRPSDVFNMNETGLFYRMAPDKPLPRKI